MICAAAVGTGGDVVRLFAVDMARGRLHEPDCERGAPIAGSDARLRACGLRWPVLGGMRSI